MTSTLTASVVIPCYNMGRFVDDALAGVAAQTRPALEAIVIDDGSQDDTKARALAWAGKLGPTRLIVLDGPNRGLSASRNRGMLAASSDLVALLDGDDLFLPDHLERLVPAFEHDPEIVVAFGDMMRFQDGGADLATSLQIIRDSLHAMSTPTNAAGLQYLSSELRALYIRQTRILPSSWVIPRNVLWRSGLFDTSTGFGEDLDFLVRLLRVGRAAWYDGVTARRREHGDNATGPARAGWSEPILLRMLCGMRRLAPDLTPAEVAALDDRIAETFHASAWIAAGQGLSAYHESRHNFRKWSGEWAPPSPKLLVRALLANGG